MGPIPTFFFASQEGDPGTLRHSSVHRGVRDDKHSALQVRDDKHSTLPIRDDKHRALQIRDDRLDDKQHPVILET